MGARKKNISYPEPDFCVGVRRRSEWHERPARCNEHLRNALTILTLSHDADDVDAACARIRKAIAVLLMTPKLDAIDARRQAGDDVSAYRSAIGAGRNGSSVMPPVTHAERVTWARKAVEDAMERYSDRPMDRALMLAAQARKRELHDLLVAIARLERQRWQS